MNRKGQTAVVGIMIGVMIFFTVIAFIESLKSGVTWARSSDNLDCDNSSISTGNQMTCIIVDAYLPIYIGIGLGVAVAYMGLKDKVIG